MKFIERKSRMRVVRRIISLAAFAMLAACSVQQRADVTGSLEEVTTVSDASSSSGVLNSDGNAPFIAEKKAEEEAAKKAASSSAPLRLKPGIPYIEENAQAAIPCMQDPMEDQHRKMQFPVSDVYKHLPILGQLLTAIDCGSKRTASLPSVKNHRYTAGSAVILKAAPSWMLREALEAIGYTCTINVPAIDCKKWQVTRDVAIDALAALRPFAVEIQKEACVSCW